MAEFENNNLNQDENPNQDENKESSTVNNQSQSNKVPEYSFWAEQVQGNTYSNYNPRTNSWEYGGTANNYYGSQYSNSPNNGSPYNNSQYNNSQYNNSQYNNSQYNNSQYNNSQYNNDQYNNSQYSNGQYGQYSNGQYANQYGGQYSNQYAGMNNGKVKKNKSGNKTGRKIMKLVSKAVCFGVIAAASFIGFQKVYFLINPDAAASDIITNIGNVVNEEKVPYEIGYTDLGTVKAVKSSVISEMARDTLPSIVSINSTSTQPGFFFGQPYDQEIQGSGSGIIVGKKDKELLIATNNHVVEGTDEIKVTFADGTQADAVIKGTDVTADLAVVTVDSSQLTQNTLDAISVAKLGNSDEVKVGEMAIAIGNALGYGQSVTVGYISAKDREVDVSDGYTSKIMVLLQTDAAINPGNSGGALLNPEGEVIGINTVKYASNEVEGMGYAIPISKATPVINELMEREILGPEEQGYLGITGNDVTEEDSAFYNMPVGVFINEITEGGAAGKAGLQPGDIITDVNGIDITSITQLRDYVNSRRVGTEVKVTYMRNTSGTYEKATVTVILGQNPTLAAD
jgi:serine protease Do